jgi:hypothetical protein
VYVRRKLTRNPLGITSPPAPEEVYQDESLLRVESR